MHFLPGAKLAHRYKLFHDPVLRDTVLGRLRMQCVERGFCSPDVTVRLGLVHAHATKHNALLLREIFKREKWLLYQTALWMTRGRDSQEARSLSL